MSPDELQALRKSLGLSQAEMGARLDLSLRGYRNLETGERPIRDVHTLAAERLALSLALERGDPMLAPASIRREALALVRLITDE